MKSLNEINALPISTSQKDLKDRVDFIFDILVQGENESSSEFAQAFSGVIGYQSYAGALPIESESKLLSWIKETYIEEKGYIESVISIYCMMSEEVAKNELDNMLLSTNKDWVKILVQEALNEFE